MAAPHESGVYRRSAAVRAGILVTGTEVVTGAIEDRNGPWLSAALSALGVEVAEIELVGDRPRDVRQALEHMAAEGLAVIVTSGGLGPTADDLTAAAVAEFCGRELVLDPVLERRITAIVSGPPSAARRAGIRKQATVPRGAAVLAPQGTAPGLIVERADGAEGPTVVVLPGPPGELRGMWPDVLCSDAFARAIAAAEPLQEHMLRGYGLSEAAIAVSLQDAERAGIELELLEITTCLRRGELEISTRVPPAGIAAYAALETFLLDRHPHELFSRDGRTIDAMVAQRLVAGETIALAESCTGGLLAARLTDLPGASAYVLGGAVVYSNAAKCDLAGVAPELIERHGAVSEAVAQALASGVRARFGASVGVSITGVAGPGGGSAEKPVGLVWLAVSQRPASASVSDGGERVLTRVVRLPGDRAAVRARATTVAMHMIWELLTSGE